MFKNGPCHNSFFPYKQLMLQLNSFNHTKMTDKTTDKTIGLKAGRTGAEGVSTKWNLKIKQNLCSQDAGYGR